MSFDYAITDYATFVPYIYGRFMLGDKKRTKKEIEILKDLYILAFKRSYQSMITYSLFQENLVIHKMV